MRSIALLHCRRGLGWARLERAGVPAEYRTARTKPEMALAEIDRIVVAGAGFGCVVADAGYGDERAVPSGAHEPQIDLGGRNSAAPQGFGGSSWRSDFMIL